MIDTGTIALLNNRLGNLVRQQFAILRVTSFATFAAVAQETAFDQDGRIRRQAQDVEISRVDATVRGTRNRHQLRLNPIGQLGCIGGMIIGLEAVNAASARIVEMDADKNGIFPCILDRNALIK